MASRAPRFTTKSLSEAMHAALPAPWVIKSHTRAECQEAGTFDPPCAYVEAQIFGVSVLAILEGEVYINAGRDYRDFQTEMTGEGSRKARFVRQLHAALQPQEED